MTEIIHFQCPSFCQIDLLFDCYLGIKPKSQKKLFKILQIGRQLIEADKKRFKSLINLVVEKIGLEVEN